MHPIRLAVRTAGAAALVALIAITLPSLAAGARNQGPGLGSGVPALDPADIDPTCRACDDFYAFATGGWRNRHTIPAGHASWGGFDELAQRNRETLHAILEDAASAGDAPAGSDTQKLGAFYRSCMDTTAIEKAGTAPIEPLLRDVAATSSAASLALTVAKLQRHGVNTGMQFESTPDTLDSSTTIGGIGMGGLGLPDRDYYLRDDERTAKIRAAYRDYVAAQLHNLGDDLPTAAREADAILEVETALAKATPTRIELRDPKATYHPTKLADLPALGSHVPWRAFFEQVGAPRLDIIDIGIPPYVTAYDAQLAQRPPETWHAYLRFRIVDSYGSALPRRFADAAFTFRSGVLYGVTEQLPRWQRCTGAADYALRTPLGRAFVARTFPPSAKRRATELVAGLQAVLHDELASLAWMSPPTKQRAQQKLAALTKKIGYPDIWQDYSSLGIEDGAPYATQLQRVRGWNHARDMERIGKPTNRSGWDMTTATVNAYYLAPNNEIVFPAGILEPPFFNAAADDAVNYGAIGAVIGHEMTHAFDDQGRLFDDRGNLAEWWTPQDVEAFNKHAQCIVDQYNGLESLPGVHMNGKLVQGEAIADLGGTTLAFKAFQRTRQYGAHKAIDGYTPEQRFFLAYAQVWRSLQTEAYTRQLAVRDMHANDRLRVDGTLSNMPEFAAAFQCAANTSMVRKDRCQIW